LLTLAGPILLAQSCCRSFARPRRTSAWLGYLLHCDNPTCVSDVISSRFWSGVDNSDGLVAWFSQGGFRNPAPKEDTVDDLGVAAPAANSYYVK
jgi:hypothetical protein